eukprot:33366-Eustigmatos_ZCMA.PRE.1
MITVPPKLIESRFHAMRGPWEIVVVSEILARSVVFPSVDLPLTTKLLAMPTVEPNVAAPVCVDAPDTVNDAAVSKPPTVSLPVMVDEANVAAPLTDNPPPF